MPLNVRSAIGMDTGERVTISRKEAGDYVDGIWIEGTVVQIKAVASVQQPTKQQIELFTGLERNKDIKTFYINKDVRLSDEFDGVEADEILWKGRKYRATKLGEWNSYGYNVVMGVRIE